MAETFNDRLEKLAQKYFDTAIEQHKENMAAGGLTLEGYKLAAGRVQGLRAAKEMLDNALSEIKKN